MGQVTTRLAATAGPEADTADRYLPSPPPIQDSPWSRCLPDAVTQTYIPEEAEPSVDLAMSAQSCYKSPFFWYHQAGKPWVQDTHVSDSIS